MEKIWAIKDPDTYLSRKKTVVRKQPQTAGKNPVKAYNLSLLYWGGGQFYNNQPIKGSIFFMIMMFLFSVAVLLLSNYDQLIPVLREHGIILSNAFLALEVVLFLIFLFWAFNASDAYHHARRSRRIPFRGIDSKLAPMIGSLLLPGWGQFMNGQELKGSIHTSLGVVGFFSAISVVLTYLAWPLLDTSDTRFLVESIFAVSLIIVPFVPLLHLYSSLEALKVSLDDLKKEPLWERIKAAYYRGRSQGLVKGVFPRIKSTCLLFLVFIFFAIVVYYWFPKAFYSAKITNIKQMLSGRGMIIIPDLINHLLVWIESMGR
jgi:TM2 domain-containing membrane protein YozV